jgi:hypothetical protein
VTREELIAEAGLFIFYLFNIEDCYKRLQVEVWALSLRIEDIHGGEQLAKCHYLHDCITEAMRLSPGVGGILLQEVLKPRNGCLRHGLPTRHGQQRSQLCHPPQQALLPQIILISVLPVGFRLQTTNEEE